MRAISPDAFARNQAGQRDRGDAIMSPQTRERENLLKKYTTCSNTPEITVPDQAPLRAPDGRRGPDRSATTLPVGGMGSQAGCT
jgi:hypothetical protein